MSKPRPRKPAAEVSAARIAAALARWSKLSAAKRKKAVAPANAARRASAKRVES